MSFAPSLTQTSPVRRGHTGRLALWAVQFALAGMFLLAGGSKLFGVPATVALFDAIGIGQWFRYVTGLIEVGSAIALLVPSFAVFGALALVATMVGAIVTHLSIVGGSPAMPGFSCSDRQQSCGLEGVSSNPAWSASSGGVTSRRCRTLPCCTTCALRFVFRRERTSRRRDSALIRFTVSGGPVSNATAASTIRRRSAACPARAESMARV